MDSSKYYRLDEDRSVVTIDSSPPLRPSSSSVVHSLPSDSDRASRCPPVESVHDQTMDWASDDGIEHDVRQLRRTGSDNVTTSPALPDSIPGQSSYRENCRLPVYRNGKPVSRRSVVYENKLPNENVSSLRHRKKRTTPVPTLLHGKNILLEIITIDSIESNNRDSDSMDWSTSLGAIEENEDLSLMDPLYDLTSARMKKLFSSFNPQGPVSSQIFSYFYYLLV